MMTQNQISQYILDCLRNFNISMSRSEADSHAEAISALEGGNPSQDAVASYLVGHMNLQHDAARTMAREIINPLPGMRPLYPTPPPPSGRGATLGYGEPPRTASPDAAPVHRDRDRNDRNYRNNHGLLLGSLVLGGLTLLAVLIFGFNGVSWNRHHDEQTDKVVSFLDMDKDGKSDLGPIATGVNNISEKVNDPTYGLAALQALVNDTKSKVDNTDDMLKQALVRKVKCDCKTDPKCIDGYKEVVTRVASQQDVNANTSELRQLVNKLKEQEKAKATLEVTQVGDPPPAVDH